MFLDHEGVGQGPVFVDFAEIKGGFPDGGVGRGPGRRDGQDAPGDGPRPQEQEGADAA